MKHKHAASTSTFRMVVTQPKVHEWEQTMQKMCICLSCSQRNSLRLHRTKFEQKRKLGKHTWPVACARQGTWPAPEPALAPASYLVSIQDVAEFLVPLCAAPAELRAQKNSECHALRPTHQSRSRLLYRAPQRTLGLPSQPAEQLWMRFMSKHLLNDVLEARA
jgi:hypothetical protein